MTPPPLSGEELVGKTRRAEIKRERHSRSVDAAVVEGEIHTGEFLPRFPRFQIQLHHMHVSFRGTNKGVKRSRSLPLDEARQNQLLSKHSCVRSLCINCGKISELSSGWLLLQHHYQRGALVHVCINTVLFSHEFMFPT